MSQATVTGKVMGAITITAKVIPNVKSFSLHCDSQLLKVVTTDDTIQDFDISAATTFTLTYSAPNYSLTVS